MDSVESAATGLTEKTVRNKEGRVAVYFVGFCLVPDSFRPTIDCKKLYPYLSEDGSIQPGDPVFVSMSALDADPEVAIVKEIQYRFPDELELPIEKIKHIYCKFSDGMSKGIFSVDGIHVNKKGVADFHDYDQLHYHVTFPPKTKAIKGFLFCTDRIHSVWIPASVEKIGSQALSTPDLVAAFIPASTVKIANDAFAQCCNLRGLHISPENPNYKVVDPYVLSDGGTTLFRVIDPDRKELTIPHNIKTIGDTAFAYHKIESLDIPEGVQAIGQDAFAQSNLRSIHLPSTLLEIGNRAFAFCSHLESITIPQSVKTIGYDAFAHCKNLKYILVEGDSFHMRHSFFPMGPETGLCPLMAPSISILDFEPNIRLNALLGFCELKRQGISMNAKIEAQYLSYLKTQGGRFPAEVKHDPFIASLIKKASGVSHQPSEKEIEVHGNASEELKQLIRHIKANHLEGDITLNSDGVLLVDFHGIKGSSYNFGFDCSADAGFFYLFHQVPDDDPLAVMKENGIYIL